MPCNNCGSGCGCNDCCPPIVIPTPPPAPICDVDTCVELFDAKCVKYTGPSITCLGLVSGESNMNDVVEAIASKICATCINANLYSFPMRPNYLISGIQQTGCGELLGPLSVSMTIKSIKINGIEKLTDDYTFVIDDSTLDLITAANTVSIVDDNCDIVTTGYTYGNLTTALNYLFDLYDITNFSAYTSLVSIPLEGTSTDAHFYIQFPVNTYFEIILEMDEGFITQFKYTRDGLFYSNDFFNTWVIAEGGDPVAYQNFIINISPIE